MKKDLSPDVWMTTSEMDADSRRTEEELKKPEFAENHIRAFLKVGYKAWKENQIVCYCCFCCVFLSP